MFKSVLAALAMCVFGSHVSAACERHLVHLTGDWGQATFEVELALNDRDRAIGLMNRDFLPRQSGMLFVFQAERERSFWMKNTRIPLDILYFNARGRLVSVVKEAVPFDLTKPQPTRHH